MMAKKKSWFSVVKRFFVAEKTPGTRLEKKEKRKRWAFKLLKMKQSAPLLAPSPHGERPLQDAQEMQSNHEVTPVIVAAPPDKMASPPDERAPEVEQLVSESRSFHQQEEENQETSRTNARSTESDGVSQHVAATKIQAAFRCYLARKALRALQGIVKLQALIRGWAVRRQAINTLKCLQSIVNIHSEVCAQRCGRIKGSSLQDYKFQDLREKDIKIDVNSQRRWDDSIMTKEESKALFLSKREAAIKRERIKEYYLSHRRSAETERDKVSIKRRYWLEQWVDAQLAKRHNLQKFDGTFPADAENREEPGDRLIKLKNLQKQYQSGGFDSPENAMRGTFHHRKQRSTGDDCPLGSPAIPTYMAATESAKAKTRSMSTPRLRPINLDVRSEINSPYKHKLSPISSINSELTSCTWVANQIGSSQRSPRLKGVPGPIKSSRSVKEQPLDSEGLLPNWDRCVTHR